MFFLSILYIYYIYTRDDPNPSFIRGTIPMSFQFLLHLYEGLSLCSFYLYYIYTRDDPNLHLYEGLSLSFNLYIIYTRDYPYLSILTSFIRGTIPILLSFLFRSSIRFFSSASFRFISSSIPLEVFIS